MWGTTARAVHGAGQVDVERLRPRLVTYVGQRRIADDAGVVHEDVQPAPPGDRRLHGRGDRARIRDVGPNAQRLGPRGTELVHGALQAFGIPVHEGHARTRATERQRRRGADAASRPGHEGHAAVE